MYEAELWVRLRFGRICRRSKLTMHAGTMMVVVHGCGAATRNRTRGNRLSWYQRFTALR